MKKAAIVTLIGYLLLIVMSVLGIYSALEMFRNFEEYGGEFPVSKDLYMLSHYIGLVPEICYAMFFLMVLQNKLRPIYGIVGASVSFFLILFEKVIWYGQDNTDILLYLFFLLCHICSALFLLQYFVNLKIRRIPAKLSVNLACLSFVLSWLTWTISIVLNFSRNMEQTSDLAMVLSINIPSIINLVAVILASVFFFAMAKNISKNGK